jgi:hypothetical protein
MNGNSERREQELRMLYPVTIEDIRHLKRQQWSITYYGLLLDGAIVGFYKLLSTSLTVTCKEKAFLLVAAFVVFLICVGYLIEHQYRLTVYRKRLKEIRDTFTEKTKEILPVSEHYTSFGYFFGIVIPFIVVLTLGVIFIAWILFR